MIDKKIIGSEPKLLKIFKLIKKIIGWILSTIFIIVILVNIVMIIKMSTNSNNVPDFLGYKFFVITTGSMQKTINIGDFIVVKSINPKEIKEEDIISFNTGKDVVTHRVIKKETEDGKFKFTTKGDNNNVEDASKVAETEVEGKYLFTVPFVGKVVLFTQSTSGMLVLLLIPATLIFLIYWKRQRKDIKELERDQKRIKYKNIEKSKKY